MVPEISSAPPSCQLQIRFLLKQLAQRVRLSSGSSADNIDESGADRFGSESHIDSSGRVFADGDRQRICERSAGDVWRRGADDDICFVHAIDGDGNGDGCASGNSVSVTVSNPNPGAAGSTTSAPVQVTAATAVTAAAAVRFLEQSTFGPTPALVSQVQQSGFVPFLTSQFTAAQSTFPDPATGVTSIMPTQQIFFTNAMSNPDQLRQRVAFALSEIFVTSNLTVPPQGMAPYMRTAFADAFTNYETIMQDVTLSPAMGLYLNMVDNDKPNATNGTHANENYSRELMQLFTLGLYLLNERWNAATGWEWKSDSDIHAGAGDGIRACLHGLDVSDGAGRHAGETQSAIFSWADGTIREQSRRCGQRRCCWEPCFRQGRLARWICRTRWTIFSIIRTCRHLFPGY